MTISTDIHILLREILNCCIGRCHSDRVTPGIFATSANFYTMSVTFRRGLLVIDNINQLFGFVCFTQENAAGCDQMVNEWIGRGTNYIPFATTVLNFPTLTEKQKINFCALIMCQSLHRNVVYTQIISELFRDPGNVRLLDVEPSITGLTYERALEYRNYLEYNVTYREAWESHMWEPTVLAAPLDFAEAHYQCIMSILSEIVGHACGNSFFIYKFTVNHWASLSFADFYYEAVRYTNRLPFPIVPLVHRFVKCAAAVASEITELKNSLFGAILNQVGLKVERSFWHEPNIISSPLPFQVFQTMYFYVLREDNFVTNMLECDN